MIEDNYKRSKIKTPFLWNFVSEVFISSSATAGQEYSKSVKEETGDGCVTITFDKNQ